MTRDRERHIASANESIVVDWPTSYDEALDQYHAWAKELLRKGVRIEPFATLLLEASTRFFEKESAEFELLRSYRAKKQSGPNAWSDPLFDTLDRLIQPLGKPEKDHPLYKAWQTVVADVEALADNMPVMIRLADFILRAHQLGSYVASSGRHPSGR